MPRYLHLSLAALVALLLLSPTAFAQDREDDDEADIHGTIRVERGADLAALAKITAAEARKVALEAYPDARISEVELEAENGFLVYEVELMTNGEELEVIIDAGDGAVLLTEREDEEDEDGDDDLEEDDDDGDGSESFR